MLEGRRLSSPPLALLCCGPSATTRFLLVLVVDQALKVWIKTNMMLGQEIAFFDWFIIHFTENKGMAFGMEFGGNIGKYILSIFRKY